jgi:hypothetical protein
MIKISRESILEPLNEGGLGSGLPQLAKTGARFSHTIAVGENSRRALVVKSGRRTEAWQGGFPF